MSDAPAIVLVDHGSRRPEANEQLDEIARRIRTRDPDRIVRVAHMEIASPSLAEAIAECVEAGATEIIVHPYLLAPGRHSQEDIPAQAAAAATRHAGLTVRVSEPLGLHDALVDVVLQRVAEAERDEPK
jgi:sirohydrochlorin ferrochelatase